MFTNFTSGMLNFIVTSRETYNEYTIEVSQSSKINEQVVGEYTFLFTVYQVNGNLKLNIPMSVIISNTQPKCQIFNVKLKSPTIVTSSVKETYNSPFVFELEIGQESSLTIDF